MTDRFVALDVETANPDLSSICQIGLATFAGCAPVSRWQTYVDPEDYFDPWNVEIHGITEGTVRGAPTFSALFPELCSRLTGEVVVHHTHFDRVAFKQAQEKYGLQAFGCKWLDSARIVRRAWPQFSQSGYGLASVTEYLGIPFEHHVAVEDARAAGEIVVRAIAHTSLTLDDWLTRVERPIHPYGRNWRGTSVAREGNPDGPLAGEIVVFTGALSLPRREVADLAAQVGCTVADGVNKHTTLLIVGDQDIRRLAGQEKSSKHRKAEELIGKGQPIRILCERDFRCLVGIA